MALNQIVYTPPAKAGLKSLQAGGINPGTAIAQIEQYILAHYMEWPDDVRQYFFVEPKGQQVNVCASQDTDDDNDTTATVYSVEAD